MNRRDFLKTISTLPLATALSVARSSMTEAQSSFGHPALSFPLHTSLLGTSEDSTSINFLRRSPATAADHRHRLYMAKPGEARFQGVRRVANLVTASEDFALYNGYDDFLVTRGTTDPAGGRRASTITARRGGAKLLITVPAEPGHVYVNAIYLRARSGSGKVWLAEPAQGEWVKIDVQPVWQRFSLGPARCRDICTAGLKLAANGDTVDLAFIQIEDVTTQDSGDRRIGDYVSVGVLPPPFHGASVDGVKYFSYENGNTVSATTHAVVEARGAEIADALIKGVVLEGPRTNLCKNFNLRPIDLSGITVTGGNLQLVDDSQILFAPPDFNPYVLIPHPELAGLANGHVYRFNNNTRTTQIVRIAGSTGAGIYSGFIYARSTNQAATFGIGNKATVSIDASDLYNNNNIYTRFSIENVKTSANNQLQLVVPAGCIVHFIGNQLEEGSFCSSLIEVRGGPAKRDGDTLSYAIGTRFPAAAGTAQLCWTPAHSAAATPADGDRALLGVSSQEQGFLLSRGSSNAGVISRDGSSVLSSDHAVVRDAMIYLGLTWKVGSTRQLFINGRLAATGPFVTPWSSDGHLEVGSWKGTGQAFGSFKNLRVYATWTPASPMIEGMTVKRARVLFDGKQVQDFYLSRVDCQRYVARLKEAGFNVIFPYVWGGNGTRYINRLGLPIDYTVAKYYKQGYDGLAHLIETCHAAGIEVHPVFMVTRRGWSHEMAPFDRYFDNPSPPPPEKGQFYNIHMAEFRDWIVKIMIDFARSYNIDGLCFDYLRADVAYVSSHNVIDYKRRYGRDLRIDKMLGFNGPGVKLRNWNREDIEDILYRTVAGVRSTNPRIVISNAGLGQCFPIRGSDGVRDEGQYNVDWVNSGMLDYIIPWDYGHPMVPSDWDYKRALKDRRRGTVMGGLYHGPRPAEPIMLHSIMPQILADDGHMAALYPYWTMSNAHVEILKHHYFQLPARIPWR